MMTNDAVRKNVAEAYARAVTHPTRSGQAGQAGCGCGCNPAATPKGVAARTAGYGVEELAGLPVEAVANSFGCGNPLALAGIEEGQVVLDLGSGAGMDLLLAAPKVGPRGRVIGVDMTDAMIDRARANIEAAGFSNVEVRKGLIEDLPVASGSVDWVISNCVINLSPEKDRVFREIARVLRPGGRMSVADIVVEQLPARLRANAALYVACLAGAVSEAEYRAGLEEAGLSEVEVVDRLVYEGEQLGALVASELASGVSAEELPEDFAAAFSGKVQSLRFVARKEA